MNILDLGKKMAGNGQNQAPVQPPVRREDDYEEAIVLPSDGRRHTDAMKILPHLIRLLQCADVRKSIEDMDTLVAEWEKGDEARRIRIRFELLENSKRKFRRVF